MSEDQLFLVEVLLNKIHFDKELGLRENIRIQIRLGDLINVELKGDIFTLLDEDAVKEDFNLGKSILFSHNPKALVDIFASESFDLKYFDGENLLGASMIPVEMKAPPSKSEPKELDGLFDIKNAAGDKIGSLTGFVRISNYEKSIETQYYVNESIGVVVQNSNQNPENIKCEFSDKSTIVPLVAICNLQSDKAKKTGVAEISWADLFNNDGASQAASVTPFPFDMNNMNCVSGKMYGLDSSLSVCLRNKEKGVMALVAEEVLTSELINKRLCKDECCPGVKLFKEYGLGCLANRKEVSSEGAPGNYNLSHASGSIDKYGPNADYTRPKHPDEPFVPLRLKGGGFDDDDESSKPKSPFKECQDIMQQFDTIIEEYRKAIGPCGQAICPYSPNVALESCKKTCDFDLPPKLPKQLLPKVNEELAKCPGPSPNYKMQAACGSPRCAYTKYKTGLIDDDAEMELQFLPPAMSGKCGHPKCKYPYQPDLPPIHWDCPEPLPKDVCKNPNCPYLPADLKALKVLEKKGPCGSTDCPYILPPPCEVPTCPFIQKSCPYKDTCANVECPFAPKVKAVPAKCTDSLESLMPCDNPDCPFAKDGTEQDDDDVCDNPECPYAKPKDSCGQPGCPFAEKKVEPQVEICDNPECPYAKEKPADFCGNPKCPYAKEKPADSCGNPECPFAKKKSVDFCDNPECPFAKPKSPCTCPSTSKKVDDVCDNPECPYASKKVPPKQDCPFVVKKEKVCEQPERVCSNPDCPYSKKPDPCNAVQLSKDCTNPDCPFRAADSVCNNPHCPFAKKNSICDDPYCPYLQPLPSCGVPNCPFEKPPQYVCPDPSCPSRKQSFKPVPVMPVVPISLDDLSVDDLTGTAESSPKIVEEAFEVTASGDVVQKRKRRKRKGKFVYSIGDSYPGMKIGHRECNIPQFKVPRKMGWLWNIHTPCLNMKPRRGWRPGAISKTIAARIKAHHQAKNLGILKLPDFKRYGGLHGSGSDITVAPKPTLQIKKKEGCYWITMNPLKDPSTLVENENPYMECTPMQFKITKKKTQLDEDECCCDQSSSSSDSELDIEFTPPAGIIHPERFKKKPNVIHIDTQYDVKDVAVAKKKSKADTKKKGKKGGKGKKGKKGEGKKKPAKGKKAK